MSAISTPTRPRTARAPGWTLAAGLLASSAGVTAALGAWGTGEDGLQLLNRYLARLAFPLFLLPFTASALRQLFPGAATRWLVRRRRTLGLTYAFAQYVHLGAIVAYASLGDLVIGPSLEVIGGGLGMVWIGAMAATSNDAAVRALGARRWRRLHRWGGLFVWGVYTFTYLGRVAGDVAYAPGLALCLAAIGLRGAASLRRRRSALVG